MNRFNGRKEAIILSLNAGSSTLKLSLIRKNAKNEEIIIRATVDNIDNNTALICLFRDDILLIRKELKLANHIEAAQKAIELINQINTESLDAIGHRVVHGGMKYAKPIKIDEEVIQGLRSAVPLARIHLPMQIALIEWAARAYPEVPQVACFDTWFHRSLPQVARQFPLPYDFYEQGLLKYGFHGLSYESVLFQLKKRGGARLIIAHLGNGASLTLVKNGHSLDTTMGFTPIGGTMMGTRCGDLDPGLLLYLLKEKEYKESELDHIINYQSGLFGISGKTSNMKELQAMKATDCRAHLAIDMFCYRVRKNIGALATVSGGLDALVFTGGIGENNPDIRFEICRNLDFLGISLDKTKNNENQFTISNNKCHPAVFVIHAQEDLVIARHTATILAL